MDLIAVLPHPALVIPTAFLVPIDGLYAGLFICEGRYQGP